MLRRGRSVWSLVVGLGALLVITVPLSVRPGVVHATTKPMFFAHYYIWWDINHWQHKLGSVYPYTAAPLPLPGTLASNGCTGTALYTGDTLLDVPSATLGLYSQDNPSVLDTHINMAVNAGLSGFVVSWIGTGQTGQSPSSSWFDRRLDLLVSRVDAYNATHTTKFYLILGYEGANGGSTPLQVSWVKNDWQYFVSRYATNPAFHIAQYGSKPILNFMESHYYSVSSIAAITPSFRSALTILGDEILLSGWNRGVAPYFDGNAFYWAAQDPYNNPASFSQVAQLASVLHSTGKLWFAPLNGGFNRSNFGLGGPCIPRNGGQTMQKVYTGNKPSNPDGWMYISWNEWVENTYVEPSIRYGNTSLTTLKNIIASA